MTQEKTTKERLAQQLAVAASIKASSAMFGIPEATIMGRSRKYSVAKARHIAVFSAREIAGVSYPDLAKAFNRSDHNTSLNSCEVVRRKMQDFDDFKALVEGVIRRARTILADDGKLQPA